MKAIQEQLKKSDAFFNAFKTAFEKSLLDEMRDFYTVKNESSKVAQFLSIYAAQMFNMTDSVVDKDMSYPEYRMAEEADSMQRVLLKMPQPLKNTEFFNRIHQRSKQLIVLYFDEIYDLSGNGFRVLEFYCRLYTHEFVSALTSLQENQNL